MDEGIQSNGDVHVALMARDPYGRLLDQALILINAKSYENLKHNKNHKINEICVQFGSPCLWKMMTCMIELDVGDSQTNYFER